MRRRKIDDGPMSPIARYAYGWSDDKASAWREVRLIVACIVIGSLIAWLI